MKNFIKKIEWSIVFLFLSIIFCICVCIYALNDFTKERPKEERDMIRKSKICWTYSNDFWRNDVDFIDGKCYYKGKEVEIK